MEAGEGGCEGGEGGVVAGWGVSWREWVAGEGFVDGV